MDLERYTKARCKMDCLVSVIVPVYNVSRYLKRCLNSILNQTYRNLEVILVDDGSKDESGKLCDQYAIEDDRVKVIHKQNAGLGMARNSGLDIATGEYVVFIDGDDYIGADHINTMIKLIAETRTDTCLAGHTKVYADRENEHKNVCAGKVFKGNVKEEILPRMCGADINGNDYIEMSVCMVMLSNEIIKNNHLRFVSEREFVSEDLVFDFSYYPLSKGVCVSELTDYYYCDNEGSLTTKYRADRFASQIKMYNMLIEKADNIGIKELCKERLQNTVIAIARYSIKIEYKFAGLNGKKVAKSNVQRICEDKTLSVIFSEYDDSLIKKSSRAVNYLIKRKMYLALKCTMWIKNKFDI